MNSEALANIGSTWRKLNALGALNQLTEDEVLALLNAERNGPARYDFLVRLHQRYSSLRLHRERAELVRFVK